MLIPELKGNLGNMMFQMASTYALAKETGHQFGIIDIPLPSEKNQMNYKETIFKDWYFYKTNLLPSKKVFEYNGSPVNTSIIRAISDNDGVLMSGYFQKHYYFDNIKKEVDHLFDLPFYNDLKKKYHDISNAYFIHIRKENELDLTMYYKRAIKEMGEGIAYVVTDDIEWCKNVEFLRDIPHRFIEENEVETLTVMINCGKGGIGSNSSFSWWGLYLNKNGETLILPNKWYNHRAINIDGYYFDRIRMIEV